MHLNTLIVDHYFTAWLILPVIVFFLSILHPAPFDTLGRRYIEYMKKKLPKKNKKNDPSAEDYDLMQKLAQTSVEIHTKMISQRINIEVFRVVVSVVIAMLLSVLILWIIITFAEFFEWLIWLIIGLIVFIGFLFAMVGGNSTNTSHRVRTHQNVWGKTIVRDNFGNELRESSDAFGNRKFVGSDGYELRERETMLGKKQFVDNNGDRWTEGTTLSGKKYFQGSDGERIYESNDQFGNKIYRG